MPPFNQNLGDLLPPQIITWIEQLFTNVQGVQGPQGDPGPPGANGSPGAPGTDGLSLLNGTGAPGGGTGVDGDFYVDTSAWDIYGPKAAGTWPSAVSIIGPAGPPGASGSWTEHDRVILGADQTTISLTGLSAARSIRIRLRGRSTNTGANVAVIRMTFNGDAGSNYNTDGSDAAYLTPVIIAASQTNTNRIGFTEMLIENGSASEWTHFRSRGMYVPSTTNVATNDDHRGAWRGSAAVSTIELFPAPASGDFAAGTDVLVETLS